MNRLLLAAAILAGTASTLSAQTAHELTYEQFEVAVPHVDLETCPEDLAQDGVFCRGTILHDELHIFVFADEDAQVLRGMQSYPLATIAGLLD
ncbi:hypothetical protein [Jannaschia rubra]|uniref:Uncharacterized protein n=1 Tax=Jannaschia rubra TaxID=282197 RepID=A0A0M6XQE3_9RHOB|nr:hypothetical protein [Jannaschia rubra]CTQ32423.1 hypothetical protein JAN5088_01188 [Jannaschia rubra]SFG44662.1 hypothetical protein SAMN04488517_10516 [Jannaschia rubra]